MHTPDWGGDGNALTNFALDAVKYDYIKNANTYGAVTDSNTYYYQTNALTDEFSELTVYLIGVKLKNMFGK